MSQASSTRAKRPEIDWLSTGERKRLTKKVYFLPMAVFLLDTFVYLLFLGGALWFENLFLKVLFALLAGLMITFLFIVGHDACHQSLLPSRFLNHIIGRLAFLPSLHPFSLWDLAHNRLHHPYANLKGKDYVWTPLSKDEYDGLSWVGQALYRWHRSTMGVLTYYLVTVWLRKMVLPFHKGIGRVHGVYWADCLLVWCFVTFQIWAIIQIGHLANPFDSPWVAVSFGILIPYFVYNAVFSFGIYLQHTHPEVAWFEKKEDWNFYRAQIGGTVHVIFPDTVNRLFHWVWDHTAHHALPSIPFYNLEKAQERLEAAYPSAVVCYKWTPSVHLDITRKCKLYDYRNYCWVDYDGNRTTETNLLPVTP